MAQFKALADTTYINPVSGQKVSYTADQLKDPAMGFLSDQFKVYTAPTATAPATTTAPTQEIATAQAPAPYNPYFGIPTEISSKITSTEQAQTYQDDPQKWIDQSTGQSAPIGVGMPQPLAPMGSRILNEADLQTKREELSKAGVPQADWSKYITSPDAQGNLFYNRPATLISPTGEKRVVASGSPEATQLIHSNWTLMGGVKDGTITAHLLKNEVDINIAKDPSSSTFLADTTVASAKSDAESALQEIKRLQTLLTPPESELSKSVSKLLGEIGADASTLTGRGAAQLAEEEKRGIEAQQQALSSKATELNKKVAEIDALTASYNLANTEEEGRPQTLSRLQGAQARNYKMYLAQKNLLTSEAGYIQAELLGMQGKLDQAQKAADRAVELEYMDRESAYNAKIAQLNVLMPQLEKEEARYASSVQIYLQQQADALAEQKQATRDIMDIKLKAISAGITDASVLTRISSAKSYDEALQILGENMPKAVGDLTAEYKNYVLAGGEATGMTFAEWQGKVAPGEISPYQTETAQKAIQSIDELIPQISGNTTGWGAFFLGKLPESEARNFAAQLDTLKSNIAFGALTAMREASKTGGALGQVSDREIKLLESTLGALDQLQSGDQLKVQLEKIKESILRWTSAVGASTNTSAGDYSW
jgi:hypothetical protein